MKKVDKVAAIQIVRSLGHTIVIYWVYSLETRGIGSRSAIFTLAVIATRCTLQEAIFVAEC